MDENTLTQVKRFFRKPLPDFSGTAVFLILLFFVLWMTWLFFETQAGNPAIDWGFHMCYSESFDAAACSNGNYEYYAPLTHLLARLLSWPVTSMLVLAVLMASLAMLAGSWWGPWLFFGVFTPFWLHNLYAGFIPFYAFVTLFIFGIAFWDKMRWWHKLAWLVLGLLAHNYGGLFLLLTGAFLEFFHKQSHTRALLAVLLLTLAASLVFNRASILLLAWASAFVATSLNKLPASSQVPLLLLGTTASFWLWEVFGG